MIPPRGVSPIPLGSACAAPRPMPRGPALIHGARVVEVDSEAVRETPADTALAGSDRGPAVRIRLPTWWSLLPDAQCCRGPCAEF